MIKEYYPIWGEKITEQEAHRLKNFKIRWIDGLYNLPFKEQHVMLHLLDDTESDFEN